MTITDIVNKVYFLTKTNSSSFLAADMLILINNAYERVASLIIQADGRWQFDDSNYTDLPIATTTITSGQQDYSLATTHLNISRIEVKDSTGAWHLLTPIDKADVYDQSITDFMATDGVPQYYDKFGNTIMLYPTPNYTQTASIKIFFERGPDNFTSAQVTTGTKVPGFNSLYHDIIPLWVSYEYAYSNSLPATNKFLEEVTRKEEALKEDFQLRNQDEHIRITAKKSNTAFK